MKSTYLWMYSTIGLFIAALIAGSIAIAQPAPSPLEAASGRGKYSDTQRFEARLNMCVAAVSAGANEKNLDVYMDANKFKDEAKVATKDVCKAFVIGLKVGYSLNNKQKDI